MKNESASLKGLIKKAEDNRAKSRFHESLKIYLRAKDIASAGYDIDAVLDTSLGAAHAARLTGDFVKSIDLYEDALDIAEAEGKTLTTADCITGLSLSLKGLCRWKEALKYIGHAKAIYKIEKDTKGLAYAIWAEGAIWRVAGEIKKAIGCYKKAKNIFDDIGFNQATAYCLCGLGGCTRVAGEPDRSFNYYEQANRIFRSIKDTFGKAYSHCGLGNAYRIQREFKHAEAQFKKASDLYESIGDIVSYSYTLWGMANMHKLLGSYDKAEVLLTKAEANFKKTGDLRGIVYCQLTGAEMTFMQGHKKEALRMIKEAMKASKGLNLSLETTHCELLYDLMMGKDIYDHKIRYKSLGVTLRDASLPLNIP